MRVVQAEGGEVFMRRGRPWLMAFGKGMPDSEARIGSEYGLCCSCGSCAEDYMKAFAVTGRAGCHCPDRARWDCYCEISLHEDTLLARFCGGGAYMSPGYSEWLAEFDRRTSERLARQYLSHLPERPRRDPRWREGASVRCRLTAYDESDDRNSRKIMDKAVSIPVADVLDREWRWPENVLGRMRREAKEPYDDPCMYICASADIRLSDVEQALLSAEDMGLAESSTVGGVAVWRRKI